jgi:DNA ligase (NAD+)
MDEIKRITDLECKIRYHRDLYYNEEPEISDAAFDALVDTLRVVDPESEVLDETGAPVSEKTPWEKKRHSMPMMSLNKVNSVEELADWSNKVQIAVANEGLTIRTMQRWAISEKMDGISIALHYEAGELTEAITRGDGLIGEDIIDNVRMMRGAPEFINGFNGWVRGEIVLEHDLWEKHFPDMSNPRNAASGIAKSISPEKRWRCAYLSVYAYDMYAPDHAHEWGDEYGKFDRLLELGFTVPFHRERVSYKALVDTFDLYRDELRDSLNYDIDGLVIRYNEQRGWDAIGKSNDRPLGSVALKFENPAATTTLEDIEWQVGKTGRITPVAIFEAIDFDGAMVSRATLHNLDNFRDLKLYPEATIVVERANEVIPQVKEVVKSKEQSYRSEFLDPTECPACGAETERDGAFLICPGADCPAQLSGHVGKWLDACGVLGWGGQVIDALVEQGMVETIDDLYWIVDEEFAKLRYGSGVKVGGSRAKAMLSELRANTKIDLARFIKGLNIPQCGERLATRAIETGFDTIEKLRAATETEMRTVPKVGPKKATAFVSGLREKRHLIDKLLNEVVITERGGSLDGKSFCATGSLSESRKVIYNRIKDAGGTTKSSVTKSLDYLICNDKGAISSKAKKARKYGTPIITEDELKEMV